MTALIPTDRTALAGTVHWPGQVINHGGTAVFSTVAPRGRSPVRPPTQWTTTTTLSYTAAPPVPVTIQDTTGCVPVSAMAMRRCVSPTRRAQSPDRPVVEAAPMGMQPVVYTTTTPPSIRVPAVSQEPEDLLPHAVPSMSGGEQQQDKEKDNEFMRLLDSLEVRVDLMAQMQHTRNQIQARARSVVEQAGKPAHMGGHSCAVPQSAPLPAARIAGSSTICDALQPMRLIYPDDSKSYQPEVTAPYQGEAGNLQTPEGPQFNEVANDVEERLANENAELWAHLREQRDCIANLTQEVEGLQAQLREEAEQRAVQGDDADELREQLREALARERNANSEVQVLQRELREDRQQMDMNVHEWQTERGQLQAELQRLRASLSRASPLGSGSVVSALPTTHIMPVEPSLGPTAVAPFSRQTCGVNVTLSDDGYVATRTRGCRQSVLLGSAPLQRQSLGWYFEVEICETVEGWVGGLGIGVTRSVPGQMRRVPDKAWRMQHTFIVGYWGCVFLDGKERRTHWRADTLPAGARVGLLVSGDASGDLRVFVDGTLVVFVPGALAGHVVPDLELYPVVDVFAATLRVALQQHAAPPSPPWGAIEGAYSPPDSPAGSLASMPRSICSSA